jgi:FMN phosphatase YigB (HAD superfamily)
MIDTILFDLDGTLLQFSQKAFIETYFAKLGKVFIKLGMDSESSIKAVWAGTKAMMFNNGTLTNAEQFWDVFSKNTGISGEKLVAVESACDEFYSNEFDSVKSIITPNDVPKRLVRSAAAMGYSLVLVTNPLFPACAVTTRLSWLGLEPQDFIYISHYNNCRYSKPNLGFYREVLAKIKKSPEQCLMVGNNPIEDMCIKELGVDTFLVTDFLENETNADITAFRHGTLDELEEFILSMPNIKKY